MGQAWFSCLAELASAARKLLGFWCKGAIVGDDDKTVAPDSGLVSRMVACQKRQAREFLADMLRMRGLMPLLMKHRNGGVWTSEEKAELLTQLRILSRVSPYLLLLLLPGSALLLPGYAWWLDHRRKPRSNTLNSSRPSLPVSGV